MIDGGRHARRHRRRAQPEIGKAHDLALAHRNAAENLRQIFAGADPHQKFFGLAEGARRLKPLGIGGKLPDGFDIGREPGKSVGGALLAIEHARHRAAFDRHPGCDGAARIGKQRLGGGDCVVQRGVQFIAGGHSRYGKRHGGLRRPEIYSRPDGLTTLRVHCTKANVPAPSIPCGAAAGPHGARHPGRQRKSRNMRAFLAKS